MRCLRCLRESCPAPELYPVPPVGTCPTGVVSPILDLPSGGKGGAQQTQMVKFFGFVLQDSS